MADIVLNDLPFVDGPPEEDQTRISWIKDGENISGATTKYGNDGVMNRPVVSVQRNVETLSENLNTVKISLDTANNDIKVIQDILDVSGDIEALAQIGINTQDIASLKVTVGEHQDIITATDTTLDKLIADVGPFNSEANSVYRTVRNDLLWIKRELGQYTGQDINGVPVLGNLSSGMKHRIITNSDVITSQGVRLSDLERKFVDSDVGSLTTEVDYLREELGSRPAAFSQTVYSRLNTIDTKQVEYAAAIDDIKTSIGYPSTSSIITSVNTNTSDIAELGLEINDAGGLKSRITSVETVLGAPDIPSSIMGNIKDNTESIGALNQIVGADTSSGLRAQVSWLNQIVGTDDSGGQPSPVGSLLYRTTANETSISGLNNDVQNLQVEIGNNSSGIKGQVIALNTLVTGTNPNGSTVEERGLTASIKTNETNIANLRIDVDELMSNSNVTTLTEDVAKLKLDVSSNTSAISEVDTKVDAIPATVVTAEQNTAAVKLTADKAASDIVDINSELNSLDTTQTEQSTEISGVKNSVAALTTRVGTAEGTISSHTTQIAAVKTTADKAATDIAELSVRVTAAEGTISALTSGLEAAVDDIAINTSNIAAVKTTADKAATDITAIQAELVTIKSDISALQTSVSDLQSAGYITDAPSDGGAYVRQNGAWVSLSTFLTP